MIESLWDEVPGDAYPLYPSSPYQAAGLHGYQDWEMMALKGATEPGGRMRTDPGYKPRRVQYIGFLE